MTDTLSADLSDFTRRTVRHGGIEKTVLVTGDSGPAVIVIHEVYGFTRPTARFCRWVRDAGLRVYAPILFGAADASNPEKTGLGRILSLCVSREINLFAAGRSSPVVEWLKPLARDAHAECGGRGVGVIGMCLTGGFALAMAAEPAVFAPVMAQPGLPALGRNKDKLDVSDADLATIKGRAEAEGLCVRAYRFVDDPISPPERFARLADELGDAFQAQVLPQSAGNPAGLKAQGRPAHSVFTTDLVDAAGEPTKAAADSVIAWFGDRLR